MRQLNLRCLICTDVAARGVDLPDVRVVIQFDPAYNDDEMQHRQGRACRFWGNSGAIVSFTSQDDVKCDEINETQDQIRQVV